VETNHARHQSGCIVEELASLIKVSVKNVEVGVSAVMGSQDAKASGLFEGVASEAHHGHGQSL
jgi:hypothetical protein